MTQEEINDIKKELAKYKAIVAGSPDVIMMTDGKDGNILEVNDACISVLGYTPSELIGKKFEILFDKKNGEGETEDEIRMYDLVSSRKVKRRDGSVVPMDLFVTVEDWCGQKVVLTNFRDVSERVEAENLIKKMNEELKALNQTKDKFFSIIAHDLKSPFAGLLMLFDMLLDQKIAVSEADQLKMLTRLRESSKAVFTLIQNLLEWSMLNLDSIKINPEKVTINIITDEMINLLKAVADNKEITLANEIEGEQNGLVDLNSIKTVIRNLISNSLKFTPRGGKITVTGKEVNDRIEIMVRDTGVGMKKEQIEKVFTPGGNRSTKGTENEKGTGLGLVLCHELMVKNGGGISVESEIGKGTAFTIFFPKFVDQKTNFSQT
ncbi:MAG: ATP-binding protein [Ignavibacteriaceae bacterium]